MIEGIMTGGILSGGYDRGRLCPVQEEFVRLPMDTRALICHRIVSVCDATRDEWGSRPVETTDHVLIKYFLVPYVIGFAYF